MAVSVVAAAFFASLFIALLLSHCACRSGHISACLFIGSLPADIHVRLHNLPDHPATLPSPETPPPPEPEPSPSPERPVLAVPDEAAHLEAPADLPACTDVQLNKPDGDWLVLERLPYSVRCPWMQSAYGCEKAPPAPLKWQPRVASDQQCAYLDYTPISAARARHARVPGERYPIIVVMVGDSYLRQCVEALACRFQALVSIRKVPAHRVHIPKDGPIPQQGLREHYGLCRNDEEAFQNPPYRTMTDHCSDEALYLKFGDDLEVYFLYRSSSTLPAVRWFGINISDISVVVSEPRIWTGGGPHPRFDLAQLGRWHFNGTFVFIARSDRRGTFPRCLTVSVIRLRDDARSDGHHACIPGSPDDAMRLLLGMVANPTEFGIGCSLPEEDYKADGGQYIPLSSRGQPRPTGTDELAIEWGEGFRFTLDANLREKFQQEYLGKQGKNIWNKTIFDVDQWLEASYNRSYHPYGS